MNIDRSTGVNSLINYCADLNKLDQVLLLCNPSTYQIANQILEAALLITERVTLSVIEESTMHGVEPPDYIRDQMLASTIIFGLTKMSIAHTQARNQATQNNIKYLSLPDYTTNLLGSPALDIDFRTFIPLAQKVADLFSESKIMRVTSAIGTDIEIVIEGRKGNAAPGCVTDKILLASPPDAEANIAPLENGSNGKIVVDGSIPCREIGMLSDPITLYVENGKIKSIEGKDAEILSNLFEIQGNEKSKVLAEVGIGLNPKATLCGSMLEDEGVLGTIHFGFGSNSTIGGKNKVSFHLDHIIRSPTLKLDDKTVISDGKLLLT